MFVINTIDSVGVRSIRHDRNDPTIVGRKTSNCYNCKAVCVNRENSRRDKGRSSVLLR